MNSKLQTLHSDLTFLQYSLDTSSSLSEVEACRRTIENRIEKLERLFCNDSVCHNEVHSLWRSFNDLLYRCKSNQKSLSLSDSPTSSCSKRRAILNLIS